MTPHAPTSSRGSPIGARQSVYSGPASRHWMRQLFPSDW